MWRRPPYSRTIGPMTLLDSFRKWRRGPLAEPPTIFDLPRSAPAVPVTYRALYHYLEHRYATVVVLTFAQMETLLGCALPASASTDAEWWAGSGGSACRHSAA